MSDSSYYDEHEVKPEKLGFTYTGQTPFNYAKHYEDAAEDIKIVVKPVPYCDDYYLYIYRLSTNVLLDTDNIVNQNELMMRLSEQGHKQATIGITPYWRSIKLAKLLK